MFGRLLPYDINAQEYLSATNISNVVLVSAINELTLNLKAGGVWEDMAAIYPFIGGTAGPCSVNLVNPGTYDLSFTGSWTFTSTYGQSSATNTTWADTGINDNAFNSTGSAANIHLSAAVSYETELNDYPIGVYRSPAGGTAQGTWIGFQSSGDYFFGQARGRLNQQVEIAGANTSGFFLVSRQLSATSELYYQRGSTGATAGSVNEATVGANYNYLVGARNFNGDGQGQQFNGYIEFVTIGNGLTQNKALALYNAVKIFNQRVGKTAI